MMKKIAYFVGLIGGILGIISAIVALAVGGVTTLIGADKIGHIVLILGCLAILFSVIGIVGALLVKTWTKLSGILMFIAAIGGIICINLFYILPFILLILGGLIALVSKNKITSDKPIRKKRHKK